MDKPYHSLIKQQMRIVRERHRLIESRMRGIGIHPSQHFVLMHLSDMGAMVSQARIAELLNVTPASIARTLKNLEQGGYISRSDSAADGRRNEIAITDKGRSVVEESRRIFDQMDQSTFAAFTEAEMEALHRLQSKMIANLEGLAQETEMK